MKKVIFSLILALSFTSVSAQYEIEVKVIPDNPTSENIIKIGTRVFFLTIWQRVSSDFSISGDTIVIQQCYYNTMSTATINHFDTVEVGKLQTGKYYIKTIINGSTDADTCFPYHVNQQVDSFIVSEKTSIENEWDRTIMNLFPNPASTKQTLALTLPKPQAINLALYDLSGREVKQIYRGMANSGENKFKLDLSQLQKGVYFCKLFKEGTTEVVKVIKQ